MRVAHPNSAPTSVLRQRQPNLPCFVFGGPDNSAPARSISSIVYRIHGSNELWTIGNNVSSGCIRIRNTDVIDLYERVKVGAKVVVL